MDNKKNKTEEKLNTAKSVNKNIRSSTRKLNPILKAIVGKKGWYCYKKFNFFR